MRLGAVGLARCFLRDLPSGLGLDFGSNDPAAPITSRDVVLMTPITAALVSARNATRLRGSEHPAYTKASSMCNLYSITTNQEAIRALLTRGESLCGKSATHAGRVSGLSRAGYVQCQR